MGPWIRPQRPKGFIYAYFMIRSVHIGSLWTLPLPSLVFFSLYLMFLLNDSFSQHFSFPCLDSVFVLHLIHISHFQYFSKSYFSHSLLLCFSLFIFSQKIPYSLTTQLGPTSSNKLSLTASPGTIINYNTLIRH